jgi:hypothetical protein
VREHAAGYSSPLDFRKAKDGFGFANEAASRTAARVSTFFIPVIPRFDR